METNKIEKKREIGEKLSLQYCLQQHLQQDICSEVSVVSHFLILSSICFHFLISPSEFD